MWPLKIDDCSHSLEKAQKEGGREVSHFDIRHKRKEFLIRMSSDAHHKVLIILIQIAFDNLELFALEIEARRALCIFKRLLEKRL